MATTLDTIAQRLGVSRMAVSYALRNKPGVAEDTRRRIQELADELGYRPNAAARAIRRGNFRAIGLLTTVNGDVPTLPPAALHALERQAIDRGLRLTLAPVDERWLDDPSKMQNVVGEWLIDAALVYQPPCVRMPNAPLAELLERHKLPAVWLGCRLENDAVHADERAAARIATRNLIDRGQTQIALVTGRGSDDRRAGYIDAMNDAGFDPVTIAIEPAGLEPIRAALTGSGAPTAVVTADEMATASILLAAAELDLDVPNDLAIFAVAESDAPVCGRRVTSMRLDHAAVADAAADMLMRKLKDPVRPLPALALEPIFQSGDTCAAARAASV